MLGTLAVFSIFSLKVRIEAWQGSGGQSLVVLDDLHIFQTPKIDQKVPEGKLFMAILHETVIDWIE